MFSLLKKELTTFFGTITGYLIVIIFLITTGLFLWVFPGNYNIIENGYASLSNFFELAPWIYLFLIPAITMRMFSEERRMGTLELLITRPISRFNIVAAKFMASLILVSLTLIPTLLYLISVWQLGAEVGNIDSGATWGSYIGLLFLASAYIAIGILSSYFTSNQAIAFLVAMISSFLFYLGFDFIASTSLPSTIQNLLLLFSINEHYLSISRGVIDSRDLSYFVFISMLLLYLTSIILVQSKSRIKNQWKSGLTFLVIICASWFFTSYRLFRVDLTADKRFTLSETTKNLLKNQTTQIYIEKYLAGELPPGMKKLQDAITEKIEDLNAFSSLRIIEKTIDPFTDIEATKRQSFIENLEHAGIVPIDLNVKTDKGVDTKRIFPGIIITSNGKKVALNLLKNNSQYSADQNLNNSIELLEYEIARALHLLQQEQKPKVAFLTGHNESDEYKTADIRYNLREKYEVGTISCDVLSHNDSISALVIANPQQPFSEHDKIIIDQFLMKGGKILWCIDPVSVSLDSLQNGFSTIAFDRDLNLRDMLFKYGVRINPDLVQDVSCMYIPVKTNLPGQASNYIPAPWYFSPLAMPSPKSSVSRNINQCATEFVSSIDLVGNNSNSNSTIILTTSQYARKIETPFDVSLSSIKNPIDKRLFNKSEIPLGVALDGTFNSVFANRMIDQYGYTKPIIATSKKTRMVIISDGSIIENKVRVQNGSPQISPLGYDRYSGETFGNRDFIINAIDYLMDDNGLMELRSRVFKLRLLDKVKIRESKVFWQILNIALPTFLMLAIGIGLNFFRRRKYGRKNSRL